MKKLFEKIKLSQLYTLCNTVAHSEVRRKSYIKGKYLENALWFDETLALLEDLKIVKNNSDNLSLAKQFSFDNDSLEDFKKRLLPVLFSANRQISEQLRTFLLNFGIESGEIFFKAKETEKITFSDTRSILLELDFITASSDNTCYFVNSNYADLFIQQFSGTKLSPQALKKKQNEQDAIGLSAEKAVIEFELTRLARIQIQKNEIEHTSQENVLAGYDIKSFENYLDEHSKRIERYIEVKAVSMQDFKFYWSRTEIEMAKVFGEKYCLYLLPTLSSSTFDFENLLIVRDPVNNVYCNNLEWKREEESVSFSKNANDRHDKK